jgi:hypothetical protein
VWPWIAQLGEGRGGFYSYDFLENLVGLDIHSAERIVSEWQPIEVGDEVKFHPEGGMTAAVVEPGRALVLRGGLPGAAPFDFAWAFVVRGQPDGTTRLVVRERYRYLRWWAPWLVEPVEFISLVMSQRMVRGIKERAERAVVANPHLWGELEFPRFRGHLTAVPTGAAERMSGRAKDAAVSGGVPSRSGQLASPW